VKGQKKVSEWSAEEKTIRQQDQKIEFWRTISELQGLIHAWGEQKGTEEAFKVRLDELQEEQEGDRRRYEGKMRRAEI
jgi:hypothetical protein